MGTVFEVGPPESPGGNWVESVLYRFGSLSSGGSVFDLYRSNGVNWFEDALHDFGAPAEPAGTLLMDKSGAICGTTIGGP